MSIVKRLSTISRTILRWTSVSNGPRRISVPILFSNKN